MNADVIMNEYFLALNKKEDTSNNRKESNEKNKKTIKNVPVAIINALKNVLERIFKTNSNNRANKSGDINTETDYRAEEVQRYKINMRKKRIFFFLKLIILLSLGVSLLGFLWSVFTRNTIVKLIFAGVCFIVSVLSVYVGTRYDSLEAELKYSVQITEQRMEKLVGILRKYSVKPDKESIADLTDALRNNQVKYDYIREVKKSIKWGIGVLVAFLTILSAWTDTKLNDKSTIWFVIGGIAFVSVLAMAYFVYLANFDRRLRRKYYFHDELIYDLNQLYVFREHYKIKYYPESKDNTIQIQ